MDRPFFKPIQSQHVNTQQIKNQKQKSINGNHFSLHFQQALNATNKLVISKHAQERLNQRGIEITDTRWRKIEEKIIEAKKMGVNDSLVLLDDAALIVSAKNNTVITAMNRQEIQSQIFTNINGTIVLE